MGTTDVQAGGRTDLAIELSAVRDEVEQLYVLRDQTIGRSLSLQQRERYHALLRREQVLVALLRGSGSLPAFPGTDIDLRD